MKHDKGNADFLEKYLKVYPGLTAKYTGALCESADGVRLGELVRM